MGLVIAGFSDLGSGNFDARVIKLSVDDKAPPETSTDYDGLWHNANFTITLTATDDMSGVNETYYIINNGPTRNVSSAGQPTITNESADNILEYWSVDNIGNTETPKILTGIKLDKTLPTGSVVINDNALFVNSTAVTLTLTANDSLSGVKEVRFSNDGVWDTEDWVQFTSSKAWTLTSVDGTKNVYCQVKDNANLVSNTFSDETFLDTSAPIAALVTPANNVTISTSTVSFFASALDPESAISKVELYILGELKGNMNAGNDDTFTMTVSDLAEGNYNWYVKAYNRAGTPTTTTVRIFTISESQPPPPTSVPDYTNYYYLAVALLAAAIVLIITYVVLRKRKTQPKINQSPDKKTAKKIKKENGV
jgi:hypothetical protein